MAKFVYRPHPEAKEDEILFTYANLDAFDRISKKTKRAGKIAYDKHGKYLGEYPDLFPVFVKKEEMRKAGYTRLIQIPHRK